MQTPLPRSDSQSKSKVFLVDDHPLLQLALMHLINGTADLVVCGEASTGRQALELIDTMMPDILIVDISLEDCSGVELIKKVAASHPHLPCLALSMYDESVYALRVLRAGGRGYIMKQEMPKTVLAAIRRVLAGHVYLSERFSARLLDQFVITSPSPSPAGRPSPGLTDRELEILILLGRGNGTREVAQRLFLSTKTVEAHRENIKKKLKLKNSAELIRYAIQFAVDGGLPNSSEPNPQFNR
jgi:DNA-binding NarL/FixJ family response regulator